MKAGAFMFQVAQIVVDRGNKDVLLDYVLAYPERPVYRARVSCNGGRTWGWHRITKFELESACR